LAKTIEQGTAEGVFLDVSPMLIAYNLIFAAHMWALKHWYFRPLMTVEEYGVEQLAFALGAIVTPRRKRRYAHLLEPNPTAR
jgi:hypothetical protein